MKLGTRENPMGMAIGIISNGFVSIKWMMHQHAIQRTVPSGIYWTYIYNCTDFKKDPNSNYATARTEVVKKAQEMGSKWLMFIDSDVFIPADAISRLMANDADIISGVYWMKTEPPQPVIFKELGKNAVIIRTETRKKNSFLPGISKDVYEVTAALEEAVNTEKLKEGLDVNIIIEPRNKMTVGDLWDFVNKNKLPKFKQSTAQIMREIDKELWPE